MSTRGMTLREKQLYYAELLSSRGNSLAADNLTVQAFSSYSQFQAIVTTGNTGNVYYDMAQEMLQPTVVPDTKVFFAGSLYIQTYISQSSGQTDSVVQLNSMMKGNAIEFPIKYRSGALNAAVDTQWNVNDSLKTLDMFEDFVFSYFHMVVVAGAGNMTAVVRYAFKGDKILY